MNRAEPREITESFRLERVLKSSRSAIVFRAATPDASAAVAIKLIPPAAAAGVESCRERFLAAMAVLESAAPGKFPALLDYGFSPDGSAFMVMEFVEGERLDSLADEPPVRVLRLVLGALDGVDLLSRGGVSHGNLTPENVLVAGRGDAERVLLLGFGTAAFHGGIVGTGGIALAEGPAQFAAPEQLDPATAPTADWRSDIYSIAAGTTALLRGEIVAADAPAPSVSLPIAVRTQLVDPVALQVILEQCLRRDPGERPGSIDEFRQAVIVALEGAPAEPEPAAAVEAPAPAVEAILAPAEPPVPETPAETAARSEEITSSTPAVFTPYLTVRLDGVASLAEAAVSAAPEAPAPTAQEAAAPVVPAVEKVKTGPVPIQRLAELPTAPFPVLQAEPPAAAEPPATVPPPPSEPAHSEATPPEPAPAEESAAVAVPDSGAEAGVTAAGPAEPTVPQAAAESATTPPDTKPSKPKAEPRKKRSILPWAAGVAAVVALGSAAAWLWIQRQQPERPSARAVATQVPRRPLPSPEPVQANAVVSRLDKAEAAVALGDLPAAGAALDAISRDDVAGLSQAEQDRHATIRARYSTLRRQAVTRAMQKALGAGNLKTLGDAVKDISGDEEAAFKRDADFSASLDESRRALNLQATMLKAQRQGESAQVLQSASVLAEIVPRYAPGVEAREKAAAILEREADTLAAKGSFDLALARLDAVRQAWPGRSGLQARLDRVRAEQEVDQKFTSLMAQAQKAGADNAPEKGLELLASLPANPRAAERVQQLRDRLAKQLEQLDAQAPTLALTPGLKLEYKKGEAATLTFKIQDDHAVKGAQLFARVEGSGKFVELPFRHGAGADWSAEVSFAFHQNQTVEFYVVAADHSGHLAQLGSPQQPLKLKRKKNLFGF